MGDRKQHYTKVIIEGMAYDAKYIADRYGKDERYIVLERSKPYPCKKNRVRIYLHVIKDSQRNQNWKNKQDKKIKDERVNVQSLMRQPF